MKPIAVGLITADRPNYTRLAASSFHYHFRHYLDLVELLHADDGSADQAEALSIAAACDFQTVYAAPARTGQMVMLRTLVVAAARAGCHWYLHLENDWEWCAPFPWHVLALDPECIRPYGPQKARGGPRAETGRNLMGTTTPIDWQPVGQGLERAEAHWAGPPSLTRTQALITRMHNKDSFKGISLAGPLDTVRVTENCVWHIGGDQTPDFLA